MKRLAFILVACGPPQQAPVAPPAPSASAESPAHSIVVTPPQTSDAAAPVPMANEDAGTNVVLPQDVAMDGAAALAEIRRASAALVTCRTPSGPSGQGHVRIVFAPDGTVSRAEVDPPFSGTPTGKCIEKAFEQMKIPAFTGAPVTIGKSFSVPP